MNTKRDQAGVSPVQQKGMPSVRMSPEFGSQMCLNRAVSLYQPKTQDQDARLWGLELRDALGVLRVAGDIREASDGWFCPPPSPLDWKNPSQSRLVCPLHTIFNWKIWVYRRSIYLVIWAMLRNLWLKKPPEKEVTGKKTEVSCPVWPSSSHSHPQAAHSILKAWLDNSRWAQNAWNWHFTGVGSHTVGHFLDQDQRGKVSQTSLLFVNCHGWKVYWDK